MFCSGSCYKELRSLQSERSSGQCQRFMRRAPCDGTAVHAFIWLPFSPNPKAALAWFQLQDSPKLPRPTWNGLQSLTVTQSRSYVPSFTEALTSDPVVYDNNSLLVLLYLSQLFNFSRRRGGEKITPWRSIKISFRVCHLRDAIPAGQSRWRFLMKERYLCSWPIPNSRWTSHWSSHKASLIKKKQKKNLVYFPDSQAFRRTPNHTGAFSSRPESIGFQAERSSTTLPLICHSGTLIISPRLACPCQTLQRNFHRLM